MGSCTFNLAWRGPCKATHECDHAGQLVCGAPLCNNCEGHTDTSKPAGGWGFMNHTHRQKGQS